MVSKRIVSASSFFVVAMLFTAASYAASFPVFTVVKTGVVSSLDGTTVANMTCAFAVPNKYLMVSDQGDLASTDGATWPSQADGSSPDFPPNLMQGNKLTCGAWANSKFAALSNDTEVHFSSNASSWTVVDVSGMIANVSFSPGAIVWTGSKYLIAGVAFGSSTAQVEIITSTTGSSWSKVSTTGLLTSAEAGTTSLAVRGLWVQNGVEYMMTDAAGATKTLYVSTNGSTWSVASGVATTVVDAGPVGSSQFFVLTGTNGSGYITSDGSTWTSVTPSNITSGFVAYGFSSAQGVDVLVGDDGSGNGAAYTSSDATNWSAVSFGTTPGTLYTVTSDGCHILAGGAGGDIVYVNGSLPLATGTLSAKPDSGTKGTLQSEPCPVSYAVVSQPAHGTVSIADATKDAYTYTPTAGYLGSDSFTYTVTDTQSGLQSSAATVNVTVSDVAATTKNGSFVTTVSHAITGALGVTRAYIGQTLKFLLVTKPSHGTVSITNTATGAFKYTPNGGYVGSDSFTFKTVDGFTLVSNTSKESISVKDVAATAHNGSVSTVKNVSVSGALPVTRYYSGQVLTFIVVRKPAHGTVTILNSWTGTFKYAPAANYTGSDSFTFEVRDSHGLVSNVATESVSIKL